MLAALGEGRPEKEIDGPNLLQNEIFALKQWQNVENYF
jgi:hypothetical protein